MCNLFECIAFDETVLGAQNIPKMGELDQRWCQEDKTSPMQGQGGPYAKGFYQYWMRFETRKDFSWTGYDLSDLPDNLDPRWIRYAKTPSFAFEL